MEKLCILMPAYNERNNIEMVVRDWYQILNDKDEGSSLIINCSGSNDGTEEEIIRLKRQYSSIEYLNHSKNTYGAKVIDLYRYSVDKGYDYIFQTDSDGQTSPLDFDRFWQLREQYDVIIGDRSGRKDGLSRRIVQYVECAFIRVFFHTKVPDANTPFKLISNELLEKYLDIIPDDYSMPNLIMTACLAANGEKLKFLPISFGVRMSGMNKMNMKKIFACGIESISCFRHISKKLKEDKI